MADAYYITQCMHRFCGGAESVCLFSNQSGNNNQVKSDGSAYSPSEADMLPRRESNRPATDQGEDFIDRRYASHSMGSKALFFVLQGLQAGTRLPLVLLPPLARGTT